MVLDKTLESPLDCKEINQSSLEEIDPEYSLEELMLLNCGVGEDFESPLHSKEIQPVHTKGNQS